MAFDQLKSYLSSPLIFLKPKEGELLYLYLAMLEYASTVLIREEEKVQKLVYYVRKTL